MSYLFFPFHMFPGSILFNRVVNRINWLFNIKYCIHENTLTQKTSLTLPQLMSGWNFKEFLHNKLRFTWGWADVLSMAYIVQILIWMAWPEFLSICPFSLLCEYNIHRGARPKVSLRWQDLRINKRRLKTCLWQFWKIGKDDKLHFGLFISWYELTQCRCHSRICRSEVRPARGSGRRVAGDPRTSPKEE